MSGKKRAPAKPKRKKVEKTPEKRGLRKIVLGAMSGSLALLGGVVALLTLLPRISVTPSDPADPNDTFSASFTIANNNFIPLRNVTAGLSIFEVKSFGEHLPMNLPRGEGSAPIYRDEWADHSLDMDDKFTVTPSDIFKFAQPREAYIGIVVLYRPWILPWKREKMFRFTTHREDNGNFHWYSVPTN